MTPEEFKQKWARYQGKESSAYQEHFNDLCRMLGQPTPVEADPTGSESFCFQKRVVKDAELFDLTDAGEEVEPHERGFADVWKQGAFAIEYKGRKKNLDEAYKQLQRYREALANPPLLMVCDFDRFIIRTNFNGTVQEKHEFTNAEIARPGNIRLLRAMFTDPEYLKPQRTTAQVTESLAGQIAEVARLLQGRESVEIADTRTRAEYRVAQRKNLRIGRFLNRIVFCLFAEDVGLLPAGIFREVCRAGLEDTRHFAVTLERLFEVMAKGGTFGTHKIRHFNGHLFEEAGVFELNEDEIRILADASDADWQFIQPSIMGTLFERALEPEQRSQLGAHYTSEADIKTLVEPVLMAPLRREWADLRGRQREAADELHSGRGSASSRRRLREELEAFQKQLAATTVLDPACGSGNFLYVSLQLLLGLEKEAVTYATQLGFKLAPQVSVQQLRALEINPYAFELAQVSVQIGFLQWRRDNGFDNDRSPVLQNLDGFQNEDALLVPHFRSKAKTLKEAQAGEHAGDDALKFYTEREWPKADVIVGNPPFLGGNKIRDELGPTYLREMWRIFENRVPGASDLCCYWFEKAREHMKNGGCRRVGLLATQSIRGGVSRSVLANIRKQGGIFFAVSDKAWILDGADVRVSMIGFDDGSDTVRTLDGLTVRSINANLTADIDFTGAQPLKENAGQCFQGSKKVGAFDVGFDTVARWLAEPNPHLKPNSDVLRPCWNGIDLVRRSREMWLVDFGLKLPLDEASKYSVPFAHVLANVKPERDKNRRDTRRTNWWKHGDGQPAMRNAVQGLARFLTTPEVAKHRIFGWISNPILPDCKLMVVAREDDFAFGLLQSRFHELWALRLCTWHGIGDDPRYTPSTCFETFPFPRPTPAQETAIAAAAQELNELRERWLNPPEWTETRILEFPGSVGGPWNRYIDKSTIHEVGRVTPCAPSSATQSGAQRTDAPYLVGTVRYPRLEPRDAGCAAKLKKRTLTNLYNERPAWLDLAHQKLDAAVAAAYGWPADLTAEQILERLLALNLERAAGEAKAAQVKKPKAQRDKTADELI